VGTPDDVQIWRAADVDTQHEQSLRDLVTLLQREIADRVERERVHELEIASQRRELAVRFDYEATLEERLREHDERIEQQDEAVALTADRRRLAAELAAESQRADAAGHERDLVVAELAAERRRASYRAVQRVVAWLQRHRIVSAAVRLTARVVTTRSNVPETPRPRA
jgi:hypothetical protein